MLIKWKDLSLNRKILAISMLSVSSIMTCVGMGVFLIYGIGWLSCLLSFLSICVTIGAYSVGKMGHA